MPRPHTWPIRARKRPRPHYRPGFELLEARETPAFTALGFGSVGADAGKAIATDAAGNVYVAGDFQGTIDFDPSAAVANLTSAGSDDVFIAKYSSAGALVWARQMGGAGSDQNFGVAVDASNNVYLTGSFTGTADFDPGTSTFNLVSAGGTDIFVVKLDSGGNFVWADRMGGATDDAGGGSTAFAPVSGNGIAVDGAGNVLVTGFFTGTADFDPGTGTFNLISAGARDIFVCKLSSAGAFVWAGRMGGGGNDNRWAESIAVDGSGNVYVTGSFMGSGDFDPGASVFTLTSAGDSDSFVVKLDSGGTFVWAKRLGGADGENGYGIAVDTGGNVYTTGNFWLGPADFDPDAGTANFTALTTDSYVSKLDSNGNFIWARQFPGNNVGGGLAIAVDGAGNVFTVGFFAGTVDFDPGAGTFNLTASGNDAYVCQLDSAGNFIWAGLMTGPGSDFALGIAIDPAGRVYVTGYFTGTVDFAPGAGTDNLTSVGSTDIFIARLPGVIINESSGSTYVTEGGATDTYTVVLDLLPAANVFITLSPDSQLTLSATTLTFTPANYNTLQTVTVTTVNDGVVEGAHSGIITHAASSTDGRYNGIAIDGVTTGITDNDLTPGGALALNLGAAGADAGQAIATDLSGNVYVSGSFQGTVDFDPGAGTTNLTSAGSDDVFVAKYSKAGALVWARAMGGAGSDLNFGVAVDAANNVYLTGSFNGTADFNPGAGTTNLISAGGTDAFVVKLDSGGNFVWAGRMGGPLDDAGGGMPGGLQTSHGIAVSAAGIVYVGGFFAGTADLDPGPGTLNFTSPANSANFVAKLDTSGNLLWARSMGSTTFPHSAIAVDGAGNVFTAGNFQGTADFDPGVGTANLSSAGNDDIFVSKLDASGNYVWAGNMGGGAGEGGYAFTVDGLGNFYFAGSLLSAGADLDPGPGSAIFSTAGSSDISIVKFDNNCNLVWARVIGGVGFEYGRGIAVDGAGNVFTTGPFSGTVDFNPGVGTFNLTSAGGMDIFVSELDSAGNFVWAGQMGGPGDDQGIGIALDPAGSICVTGYFQGTADFAPGLGVMNRTSAGSNDIFVARLPGVIINETGGSTSAFEGGATDTFTVVLDWLPTANVFVTLNGGSQVSLSATALTFTTANFNTPQTVTVTASDDTAIEGDHTGVINFIANSADPRFNGIAINSVTATIFDNDPNSLLPFQTFNLNGDYVAAGVGLRSLTSGNITVAGIPAGSTVTAAYLYWSIISNVESPSLRSLSLSGNALTGTLIGAGYGVTFPAPNIYSYRAVVTSLVSGNGVYSLTGVAAGVFANGASLVVVYANPLLPSRTVVLYEGNDIVDTTIVTATNVFAGFTAPSRVNAKTTFIVGDAWGTADNNSFTGSLGTINLNNTFNASDGNYWDTDTFNVSSVIAGGDTSVSANATLVIDDSLIWTAQVFSIGPSAIIATPSAGSTDVAEAGSTSDTYTLVLGNQPSANVIVTLTPDSQVTVSPTTITFTTLNWNSPRTVTVTAVDDLVTEGTHAGIVTQSVTSADAGYNGLPLASITANITDNDFSGVILTPTGSNDVSEAGLTDTYTVHLNSQPTANVVINLTGGTQLIPSPNTLTFTTVNWSTPQTVTIAAIDDLVAEGTHQGVVTHTATSTDANYNSIVTLTASIADNDTAAVTIVPSAGSTSVSETGLTDTYTAVLNTQPTATVVLTLNPGTQLAVMPNRLTFTTANWGTPQTVTVSAVDDVIAEGPHTGVVAHTAASTDTFYSGLIIASLTAAVADNDTANVTIILSGGSTDVVEGGAADTYTVVLNTQPTAPVVITLNPGTQLTVAPATLTFTTANWNSAQVVSVTAVDDIVYQAPHTGVITHAATSADGFYSGIGIAAVTADITDDDPPPSVLFSAANDALSILEGSTQSYSVSLTSKPADDVFITLGPDTQVSLSTTILTFTTASWSTPQPVFLSGVANGIIEGAHVGMVTHAVSSADPAYNGASLATLTANIIDNDGPILAATDKADRIIVTFTAQNISVSINGVKTLLPANLPQLIIRAGTGNDRIDVINPTARVIVQGGGGADSLFVTGRKTANVFTLDAVSVGVNGVMVGIWEVETVYQIGAAANDSLLVAAVPTFKSEFQAGLGADTVTGPNRNNTWALSASNGGILDVNVKFSAVENLIGGNQADTFLFSPGKTIGSISGGAAGTGNDTLDFSLSTAAVTVNLQTATATAVKRFQGITRIVGGKSTADKLIAANRINDWTIVATNAGTVNAAAVDGCSFQNFENLTGGTLADLFTLTDSTASWAGTLAGGTGTDTLTAFPTAKNYLNTGAGTGTLNKRKFTGIENLR